MPKKPQTTRELVDNLFGSASPREHDYAALWRAYPRYMRDGSDVGCRELFEQVLDNGVDPAELIEAAAEYARRLNGQRPRLMCYWLKVGGWKKEKYHMLPDPDPRGSSLARLVTIGS